MNSLAVVLRVPPRGDATAAPAAKAAHSPSTSSADEAASDDQRRRGGSLKKRKSSYRVRKEEMGGLRDELVELQGRISQLQTGERRQRRSPLEASLRENETLRFGLNRAKLAIAGAQSLVSEFTTDMSACPTRSFIHLPTDPDERQRILTSLKSKKMREAQEFMLARCQFHDLRRPRRQLENFTADNGDQIVVHWEMATIASPAATVERVFHEMIEFAQTHEMTLAEEDGIVTVRESDVCSDQADSTQVRLVSSCMPSGHLIEKNMVFYSQYSPRDELLDAPNGLFVYDFVDQDDLYPYRPHERVRRDVLSFMMTLSCPAEDPTSGSRGAVSLVKWSFIRVHNSPLATTDELEDLTLEGARKTYFTIMVRSIRERLAWQSQ